MKQTHHSYLSNPSHFTARAKRKVRRRNGRSDEEKRNWRRKRNEEALKKRRDNERADIFKHANYEKCNMKNVNNNVSNVSNVGENSVSNQKENSMSSHYEKVSNVLPVESNEKINKT